MKKFTMLFILLITLTFINYALANPPFRSGNPHNQNDPVNNYNPNNTFNPKNNNTNNNSNSNSFNPQNSNTYSSVLNFEDRRDLPGFPMMYMGSGLNFYYDPSQSPDSTIIDLKDLEKVLTEEIKSMEYERGKRLSNSEVFMVDQLFASFYYKTKEMQFVKKEQVNSEWQFIGYATPKTLKGKAGSFNLAGNLTVFGCDNGANRAVLETSGYRRGGEASQFGIGAAGGLSMIFESTKNAFGPAFGLMPSYSQASSAPVDNAHARFKLYIDFSDPNTDPTKAKKIAEAQQAEVAKKAEELRKLEEIKKLTDQIEQLKKSL
jgi:hypothetical protein